jgi:hypothetical protein
MNDIKNFSCYILNFFFCFFLLWQLTREFSVRLSPFYDDVICRFSFSLVRLLAATELDNISSPVFFLPLSPSLSLFFSFFSFFSPSVCVIIYVCSCACDRSHQHYCNHHPESTTNEKEKRRCFVFQIYIYIYICIYNWLIIS